MDPTTKIAEKLTIQDWLDDPINLDPAAGLDKWELAFDKFFLDRLNARYFKPMDAIENDNECGFWGKGFSIVTIQCSLIEFFQSTYEGKSYKYWRPGWTPLAPDEYYQSGPMFTGFLIGHDPFNTYFPALVSPDDFYHSVRCGLMHEARTKTDWHIHKGDENTHLIEVTATRKTLNWKRFRKELWDYVAVYKAELLEPANGQLRTNFKQKLGKLFCT